MKGSYCKFGIGKIRYRLPRLLGFVVTHPIDKIPDLASEDLGAENFSDLELRKTVDVDGRGNLFDAAWERVGHMRLQKADMEDRVDEH